MNANYPTEDMSKCPLKANTKKLNNYNKGLTILIVSSMGQFEGDLKYIFEELVNEVWEIDV